MVCISGNTHQYHAEEHKAAEKNLDHITAGSLCITDFHLLCWPSIDSDAVVSWHIPFSHAKAGSLPMPWCATLPKWIFYMSQHRATITAIWTELYESQQFLWYEMNIPLFQEHSDWISLLTFISHFSMIPLFMVSLKFLSFLMLQVF